MPHDRSPSHASRPAYPWTRYWAPLGTTLTLNFDGFLPDPRNEWGARFNPKARTWDQIAQGPCLVLLGEPGMGKSTEIARAVSGAGVGGRIKHIDLAEYSSEERLVRDAFEDGTVSSWLEDGQPFDLFFDALDESLHGVRTFAKILVRRVSALPRDRARVRIACRTADWPVTLEQALCELYPEGLGVWELLPLRRADCADAARVNGISDPERFVREVVERELQPLAFKPLTLEMLIRTVRDGGFPASRRELFEKAALLLAAEPNGMYPPDAQRFTPAQRLAIAQRVAAGTVLCGKSSIARDVVHPNPTELVLEDLAGGSERVSEATVDIDAPALIETIRTSLFSGAGPSRLAWFHHSIAEFLAARWLASAALDARHVDALIMHPEDPKEWCRSSAS